MPAVIWLVLTLPLIFPKAWIPTLSGEGYLKFVFFKSVVPKRHRISVVGLIKLQLLTLWIWSFSEIPKQSYPLSTG